jgi:hypothetical protein
VISTHPFRRNGLGALDEYGRLICGQCGLPWESHLHAQRADTPAGLRLAGLREVIHPDDAVAFLYPDRRFFEESAAADRALGNQVYGPWPTEAGLLGIVDVRPQLSLASCPLTNPALPDRTEP